MYRNFERIVQIAYQWLSEQYREGDKIFLFGASDWYCVSRCDLKIHAPQGFSRGAYQVRCLSAMIDRVCTHGLPILALYISRLLLKVGLIHRGNEAQIAL